MITNMEKEMNEINLMKIHEFLVEKKVLHESFTLKESLNSALKSLNRNQLVRFSLDCSKESLDEKTKPLYDLLEKWLLSIDKKEIEDKITKYEIVQINLPIYNAARCVNHPSPNYEAYAASTNSILLTNTTEQNEKIKQHIKEAQKLQNWNPVKETIVNKDFVNPVKETIVNKDFVNPVSNNTKPKSDLIMEISKNIENNNITEIHKKNFDFLKHYQEITGKVLSPCQGQTYSVVLENQRKLGTKELHKAITWLDNLDAFYVATVSPMTGPTKTIYDLNTHITCSVKDYKYTGENINLNFVNELKKGDLKAESSAYEINREILSNMCAFAGSYVKSTNVDFWETVGKQSYTRPIVILPKKSLMTEKYKEVNLTRSLTELKSKTDIWTKYSNIYVSSILKNCALVISSRDTYGFYPYVAMAPTNTKEFISCYSSHHFSNKTVRIDF